LLVVGWVEEQTEHCRAECGVFLHALVDSFKWLELMGKVLSQLFFSFEESVGVEEELGEELVGLLLV